MTKAEVVDTLPSERACCYRPPGCGPKATLVDWAEAVTKVRQIGKWTLAALLGTIVPALAFHEVLVSGWDFDVEPPWSWITISIVPLTSFALLFLPTSWLRPVCAILILHATLMFGIWARDMWRDVAGISLFLDLLLIAAMFRAALEFRPLPAFPEQQSSG